MDVRIENLTKTFVGRKGVETTAVNQMSFTIPALHDCWPT